MIKTINQRFRSCNQAIPRGHLAIKNSQPELIPPIDLVKVKQLVRKLFSNVELQVSQAGRLSILHE